MAALGLAVALAMWLLTVPSAGVRSAAMDGAASAAEVTGGVDGDHPKGVIDDLAFAMMAGGQAPARMPVHAPDWVGPLPPHWQLPAEVEERRCTCSHPNLPAFSCHVPEIKLLRSMNHICVCAMSKEEALKTAFAEFKKTSMFVTSHAVNCRAESRSLVKLVRTPLPFFGYHTSVIIGDVEMAFSSTGINRYRLPPDGKGKPASHRMMNGQTKYDEMCKTSVHDISVQVMLRAFFLPGTYDMLHKNCNSFSDMALYMACGRRLPDYLSRMEKVGALPGINFFVQDYYTPNEKGQSYNKAQVIAAIDAWRQHSEIRR